METQFPQAMLKLKFLTLLLPIFIPVLSFAQPIRVEIVLKEGDTPPGLSGQPVASLNAPFTNGNGKVGFTGTYGTTITETFVWYDSGVVWKNPDALPGDNLSGGESTMGIGDLGEFGYSPSINGNDGIWTDSGAHIQKGDPAPGFVSGSLISFVSRPTMIPDGTMYWVSGVDTTGGASTKARALYKGKFGGAVSAIYKSGDVFLGLTIADGTKGITFSYGVSNDGSHVIQEVEFDTGSTSDDNGIVMDTLLLAREDQLSWDGINNWDNFDLVEVNNSGDYFIQGDLTGSSTRDEMIAVNGAISVRESDTLDGINLVSPSYADAVSINDLGQIAHIWSMTGGVEALFVGNVSDLKGTSRKVLMSGDSVDTNGDGVADAMMTAFNASNVIGPGLDFAEDGKLYVEVDLEYSGSIHYDAIIGIEVECAIRPRAGSDASQLICSGTPVVDMISLLEGSPDSGGIWLDSLFLPVSASFDPSTDPEGTYYYVQTDSGCGNDTAVLNLSLDICTGLKTEVGQNDWRVFPNPTTSDLVIEIPAEVEVEFLSMLDLSGRMVEFDLHLKADNRIKIDLSGLSNGIYFLQIMDTYGRFFNRKVILQK